MPLNDMRCRKALPKAKPYKLADGEGLYLEVMPTGSKYWRWKYRIFKKEKRLALGVYPKVSLLEARNKKNEFRSQLKSGNDPFLVRLEQKQTASFKHAQTFELIAKEWVQKNLSYWSPKYLKTIEHRFEKYIFPEIGSYPIHLLTPIIILACLQKVDVTAPEMARRVKQYISNVFNYAIATNRAGIDFTKGLEKALRRYKKKHFASVGVDGLPNLLLTIHNHKARLYHQTYLAIQLMLLIFVRTNELIQAEWSEINFENKLWIIPGERMKMKLPHLVPLSNQAIEILLELKQMNGKRIHVFPSIPRPRKPMSDGTILTALKRMGLQGKMTGHGFRSLALGILKEKLGFSHEVANRQLAHVRKNSTDKAYDRAEFLPQRTDMMQVYADYLQKGLKDELIKKSERV